MDVHFGPSVIIYRLQALIFIHLSIQLMSSLLDKTCNNQQYVIDFKLSLFHITFRNIQPSYHSHNAHNYIRFIDVVHIVVHTHLVVAKWYVCRLRTRASIR